MSPWENYRLEWSPDPLTVAIPSWQDITAFALAPFGAPIHPQTGIPLMGSGAQAATMAVVLDNRDHRFTFGNASSPLSPNWKPGRRIRCYEVIGNRRFDVFSGYIQPPETDDWAESGADQYMTLTAVDRLGRLGTARTMISTLAEHIIYNGGSSLVAYWSLLDPVGSFGAANFGTRETLGQQNPLVGSFVGPPGGLYAPGAGSTLAGDDKQGTLFAPSLNADGTLANYIYLYGTLSSPIAQASGDTITLAYWATMTDTVRDLVIPAELIGHVSMQLMLDRSGGVSGTWAVDAFANGGSVSIPAMAPANQTQMLIALRMTLPSGLVELWRHTDPIVSGTTSGSPPSSATWDQVWVGSGFNGTISHVQIYVGPGAYTRSMHLAQAAAGYTGLYGQTTGQRIVTLAQYAGIPAAELSNVDPGIAPMQKATLTGQSPLAEMRVAETTEQGRLRTNGQGLLVFDSRLRRYNS
ncbi:MAG: hypothetical protein AUG49_19355 [Catenulispora sp. 13_1_20CM_3_70_7]|nr:MAG: hypothetical protein AUG49_19355 [Catenulispora sp. 13_1_20CM_3_70_7]